MRHSAPSPRLWVALAALSVTFGSACATSGGSGGRSYDSNLITREEIVESAASDLFEAVRRLRPAWLRGRGSQSISSPDPELPTVYYRESRQGPIGSLRQFTIDQVEELRYLDGRDATTRYGTGHGGGVIVVIPRG